jgi:hypothetical protein
VGAAKGGPGGQSDTVELPDQAGGLSGAVTGSGQSQLEAAVAFVSADHGVLLQEYQALPAGGWRAGGGSKKCFQAANGLLCTSGVCLFVLRPLDTACDVPCQAP